MLFPSAPSDFIFPALLILGQRLQADPVEGDLCQHPFLALFGQLAEQLDGFGEAAQLALRH